MGTLRAARIIVTMPRLALRLAATAVVAAAILAPFPARSAYASDRTTRAGRATPQDTGRPLPWFGLRLGGLAAVGSAGDSTPSAAGGGGYALFDGRDFLADVAADIYLGDGARMFALGLGAYYPFAIANITPYLGAGLKLGWTRFGGDGAFGMIPFAATGLLFGREGYVQVRAELAWFVALSREERTDRPGDPGSRANGPVATLGLAF
ncbi:MAG: hypothetical protein A2V77_10775 [Anaeromyxobacter sp. RBG_16_69_14]|nr:MAG: hypothetical protein A2V77_10775 [Anaeromyxobacter sp. RBG_16_69_14]